MEELLATLVDISHAHYRATLSAGGVRRSDLPKPCRYPRPTDATKDKPRAASRAELAARMPRR